MDNGERGRRLMAMATECQQDMDAASGPRKRRPMRVASTGSARDLSPPSSRNSRNRMSAAQGERHPRDSEGPPGDAEPGIVEMQVMLRSC